MKLTLPPMTTGLGRPDLRVRSTWFSSPCIHTRLTPRMQLRRGRLQPGPRRGGRHVPLPRERRRHHGHQPRGRRRRHADCRPLRHGERRVRVQQQRRDHGQNTFQRRRRGVLDQQLGEARGRRVRRQLARLHRLPGGDALPVALGQPRWNGLQPAVRRRPGRRQQRPAF